MQPFQSSRNSRSWSSYGAARTRDCSEIQPPPETGLMKEDDVSSCFYYLLDDPFFDRDLAGVPDPPPAPPDAHFPPPIGDLSPPFQSNQHYSYHSFNSLASPISRLPESGSSETCELILTSLSGEDPVTLPTAGDRKRKGKELANDAISEYHGEESGGHGSAKRSRAAEVRNLSVRRRRNRINEKMRALQELVPRCGKTDKASMLDEAIEYFKSLQMQVQMMSMGCVMVPMMVLGVQQYLPQMGMNQSAAQFPALPTQFQVENLPIPNVSATDPSRIQPSNQVDSFLGSQGASSADPYLQFLGEDQPDFMTSARK